MTMKGKKKNTEKEEQVLPGVVTVKIPGKVKGPDGSMIDGEVEKRLTTKEETFCQSYLIDFNGSKAARLAGYSEESCGTIASENLQKPHIRKRIQDLRDQMGEGFNITRERIALEYSRLAFLDPRKFYDEEGNLIPIHLLDADTAAALTGVEMETEKHKDYSGIELDDEGNMVDSNGDMVTTVTKIKHASKREALDSLTKLMGYAAPNKTEVTGKGGKDLGAIIPVVNLNIVQPIKEEDT